MSYDHIVVGGGSSGSLLAARLVLAGSKVLVLGAGGVINAPVRTASVSLQAEGLVEIRPQLGTFVFAPSLADLRAQCEQRVALQLEAVRLSLIRNLGSLKTTLKSFCDQMRDALANGEQDHYHRLDIGLHLMFLGLANSPYFKETYVSCISSAFAALRHRFVQDAAHDSASIKEDLGMAQLIGVRDLASLQAIMHQHIQNTEAYYEKLLVPV